MPYKNKSSTLLNTESSVYFCNFATEVARHQKQGQTDRQTEDG